MKWKKKRENYALNISNNKKKIPIRSLSAFTWKKILKKK